MRLFFSEDIDTGKLNAEETQHAIKVLRLQKDQEIHLIDGKGTLARAIVTEIDKRNCSYKTLDKTLCENTIQHLHLAIAPTKSSDRLEWMIEKMTEIGIGTIHFIHTKRTEKSKLNLERLHKKILSAAKQSHKYHFPLIEEHKSLKSFIDSYQFDQKYIAHLAEGERKYLGKEVTNKGSVCVLIGPEGDFTDDEIELAFKSNYQAVTLGEFRLRTETAAVFATTLLNHIRYIE
jgi:16S rRNA (uracil1498-N3)-methyltransferase